MTFIPKQSEEDRHLSICLSFVESILDNKDTKGLYKEVIDNAILEAHKLLNDIIDWYKVDNDYFWLIKCLHSNEYFKDIDTELITNSHYEVLRDTIIKYRSDINKMDFSTLNF